MTPNYTGFWGCFYDWQTMIVGTLGVIVTIVTVLVTVYRLKVTLQTESLLKLMDKFDSKPFREKRIAATKACLCKLESKDPGDDVDDLLDFFDDVAFLVKIGALRKTMMHHAFYHWVRLYFQASEKHIVDYRTAEPTVWANLWWVYPHLKALEKAKSRGTYKEKRDDATLKIDLEKEMPLMTCCCPCVEGKPLSE
jgi:hypothetical protein